MKNKPQIFTAILLNAFVNGQVTAQENYPDGVTFSPTEEYQMSTESGDFLFSYWNGAEFQSLFEVDGTGGTAIYDSLDIAINNGSLSVNGSPVMTGNFSSLTQNHLDDNGYLKREVNGTLHASTSGGTTGIGSVSLGAGLASDDYSFASGYLAHAGGGHSTALGHYSKATGSHSFSAGDQSVASGLRSVALGYRNNSLYSYGYNEAPENKSGDYSFAAGDRNGAWGNHSLAMGLLNNVSGERAVALGSNNTASGYSSSAIGGVNVATEYGSVAMGYANKASGKRSIAMGGADHWSHTPNTASGDYAFAVGKQNTASGNRAISMGESNTASGTYSFAVGQGNKSNDYSISMGWSNEANGNHSVAIGGDAVANSYAEVVLGLWPKVLSGVNGDSNSKWYGQDPAFRVGNGVGYVGSDAIATLKNGQTTLTNKFWLGNVNSGGDPKADPTATDDSGGNALVVEGHTVLKGNVVLAQAQGDISMGIYE